STIQSSTDPESVPIVLLLADADGDGHLDIVTANSDSNLATVGILRGQGNGAFVQLSEFVAGVGLDDVVAADLNGDGKIDIATANFEEPADVWVLLNNCIRPATHSGVTAQASGTAGSSFSFTV